MYGKGALVSCVPSGFLGSLRRGRGCSLLSLPPRCLPWGRCVLLHAWGPSWLHLCVDTAGFLLGSLSLVFILVEACFSQCHSVYGWPRDSVVVNGCTASSLGEGPWKVLCGGIDCLLVGCAHLTRVWMLCFEGHQDSCQ